MNSQHIRMMNSQRIEIKRPHVLRLVAMESAYLAAKRADADALCDTVPIVEADEEILLPMWMKSCARILSFLRLHLRREDGFRLTGRFDACTLQLSLHCGNHPGFHPDEGLDHIFDTALSAWLTKDILAAWLSMALPEREPSCRAEADGILRSLEDVIASCRHPMRVRKRTEVV